MNSLLLVNKPAGISSHRAGKLIQRISGISKTGHVGTLDLEASGLLLILTNTACRFQSHLLNLEKEYRGTIVFGIETDTDDIFGNILSRSDTVKLKDEKYRLLSEKKIKEVFSGKISQMAPRVSAKKSNGIPDYKRVRAGQEVTPKVKDVEVEVLDFKFTDQDKAHYHVRVSSGFYVRSFARDAGTLLGIKAVAESICRSSIGPLCLSHAIDLDDLTGLTTFPDDSSTFVKNLRGICDLLPYGRTSVSDQELALKIRNGNPKALENLQIDHGYHLLYSNSDPVAIIRNTGGELAYEFVIP